MSKSIVRGHYELYIFEEYYCDVCRKHMPVLTMNYKEIFTPREAILRFNIHDVDQSRYFICFKCQREAIRRLRFL